MFTPVLSFAFPTILLPHLHVYTPNGSMANANYSQTANPSYSQPFNASNAPLPCNTLRVPSVSSAGFSGGWPAGPGSVARPTRLVLVECVLAVPVLQAESLATFHRGVPARFFYTSIYRYAPLLLPSPPVAFPPFLCPTLIPRIRFPQLPRESDGCCLDQR